MQIQFEQTLVFSVFLSGDTSALKVELHQIQEDLDKVRGENKAILAQQEQLQKNLTSKETDVGKLTSELTQLKQENDKLRSTSTPLNEEVSKLKESLQTEQKNSQVNALPYTVHVHVLVVLFMFILFFFFLIGSSITIGIKQ